MIVLSPVDPGHSAYLSHNSHFHTHHLLEKQKPTQNAVGSVSPFAPHCLGDQLRNSVSQLPSAIFNCSGAYYSFFNYLVAEFPKIPHFPPYSVIYRMFITLVTQKNPNKRTNPFRTVRSEPLGSDTLGVAYTRFSQPELF
jgi:hypothetical protein